MIFNEKFQIESGFEELLIIQPYGMHILHKGKEKAFFIFFFRLNILFKFYSWKDSYTLQGHTVPWGGTISSLQEFNYRFYAEEILY